MICNISLRTYLLDLITNGCNKTSNYALSNGRQICFCIVNNDPIVLNNTDNIIPQIYTIQACPTYRLMLMTQNLWNYQLTRRKAMAQCNKTLQNCQDSIAFTSGAKMFSPPGPGIAYYTSLMMIYDVTQTDCKTNGYNTLTYYPYSDMNHTPCQKQPNSILCFRKSLQCCVYFSNIQWLRTTGLMNATTFNQKFNKNATEDT